MAHDCPDCGRLCYCDGEDMDWGIDYAGECLHYLGRDCECDCDQCLDERDAEPTLATAQPEGD